MQTADLPCCGMHCFPLPGNDRGGFMQSVIVASEKLKLYGELDRLCKYVGYTDEWRDAFWQSLLENADVYEEFLYYMEHQDFLDKASVQGYTLTDLFIWEMRKYNVRRDRSKNGPECDKHAMLLETFDTMMKMKRDQAKMQWSMEMNNGMDVS